LTDEDLRAELERLRAENEQLKNKGVRGLSLKVSEKGGLSLYEVPHVGKCGSVGATPVEAAPGVGGAVCTNRVWLKHNIEPGLSERLRFRD
jgi:hypothetical protein